MALRCVLPSYLDSTVKTLVGQLIHVNVISSGAKHLTKVEKFARHFSDGKHFLVAFGTKIVVSAIKEKKNFEALV